MATIAKDERRMTRDSHLELRGRKAEGVFVVQGGGLNTKTVKIQLRAKGE